MAYTPYTLLNLKQSVSTQLGKADYATPNTVRDTAINDARREVYGSNKWGFNKKTQAITWGTRTDGYATFPFPTSYTPEFDLGRVYQPDASLSTKQLVYTRVDIEDLPTYTLNDTSNYVYAVDYENQAIVSNWPSVSTAKMTYTQLPRDWAYDGSDDSQPEPANALVYTAIRLISVANYWLAAERDESNYDRFFQRGSKILAQAQSLDSREGPAISIKNSNADYALGFNTNSPADF